MGDIRYSTTGKTESFIFSMRENLVNGSRAGSHYVLHKVPPRSGDQDDWTGATTSLNIGSPVEWAPD